MSPRVRRLSVVSRLALSVIVVSATAIGITSIVGLAAGERAVDQVTERRLRAVLSAEQFELAAYVAGVQSLVEEIASSPTTAVLIAEFSDGFRSLTVPPPDRLAEERAALLAHYRAAVVPSVEATSGRPLDARRLLPETDVGVHLQHELLVAAGPTPGGVRRDVAATTDDDESWFAALARHDPVYQETADRLGADELALVDRRGDVVYSARRSVDVATNLLVGPHSGQSLAAAVRRVFDRPGDDGAALVDLAPYAPAGGRPVWFLVAPVRDPGGSTIGAFAVRWTVDPLNTAVAASAGGPQGVGDTGEVIVAGPDRRLRVDPRGFRESPSTYLADAVAAGTMTESDAALARARGTAALLQVADGDVVEAAATSGAGILRRTDHLGRPAIMSFGPTIASLADWVVVSQIPEDEPDIRREDYRRLLLFATALLIGAITFGAVAWAQRIVRPLRDADERLGVAGKVPGDGAGADGGSMPDGTPDDPVGAPGCEEFARLVDGFDRMQRTLSRRRDEVVAAEERRRTVLRSLLPGPVAARVDGGDRTYIDRVSSASVVVIVIHPRDGVELEPDESADHVLDGIVGVVDAVGATLGVERVKVVGDACFCAVGHQRPYLDHARRAASFAVGVVDAVRSLPIDVAIGVSSGAVNVGLGGSAHLVFDLWGSTVGEAARLARRSPVGVVLATDATRERLPGSTAIEHDGGLDAWRIVPADVEPVRSGTGEATWS